MTMDSLLVGLTMGWPGDRFFRPWAGMFILVLAVGWPENGWDLLAMGWDGSGLFWPWAGLDIAWAGKDLV